MVRKQMNMRVMRIYLTEHGKEIDAERIARVKAVEAIAHASLSDEETQVLMRLLSKIRADLLSDTEKTEKEED